MIEYLEVVDLMTQLSSPTKNSSSKSPKTQLGSIRNILEKDRNRTPLSNVLMRCHIPTDLAASVTLRRENLRDLTFSELHNNSVRLVGKVTRVIEKGSSMSAFENYGLSLLPAATLTDLFETMRTDDIRAEFSDVEIKGPAVQILPLMIFV